MLLSVIRRQACAALDVAFTDQQVRRGEPSALGLASDHARWRREFVLYWATCLTHAASVGTQRIFCADLNGFKSHTQLPDAFCCLVLWVLHKVAARAVNDAIFHVQLLMRDFAVLSDVSNELFAECLLSEE